MSAALALLAAPPWRQLAAGVALGAALHFGGAAIANHYIGKGAQQERVAWQLKESTRLQQEAQTRLQAEQNARAEEARQAKENDRVAQQQAQREAGLRIAASAAAGRVDSLRRTIEALNARARSRAVSAQPDAAALADEATRARGLLGQCSRRYADVAERAGAYAAQVTGLQDYVMAINPSAAQALAQEQP